MIYAFHKELCVKNTRGVEVHWSEFQKHCLSVGAVFFANCLEDIPKLQGWKLLLAGSDIWELKAKSKERFRKYTGLWLSDWELKRFDLEIFMVLDGSGLRPREISTQVLTFR